MEYEEENYLVATLPTVIFVSIQVSTLLLAEFPCRNTLVRTTVKTGTLAIEGGRIASGEAKYAEIGCAPLKTALVIDQGRGP